MKKLKRKIYLGVVAVAMLAMMLPLIGGRVRAAANKIGAVRPSASGSSATATAGPAVPLEAVSQPDQAREQQAESGARGTVPAARWQALGIPVSTAKDKRAKSLAIAKQVTSALQKRPRGHETPETAEPVDMSAASAFSAALMTNVGGRGSQFDSVTTLGDWSGAEQFSANHSGKVDDFSGKIPVVPTGPNEFQLTRTAISEHTIANGFPEDLFYYGDSFGNVYVSATTSLTEAFPSPNVFAINLPTVLNAFGNLASDDQVVITGLAVSPVVDLSSFAHVNGSFASFNNLIGETLLVTFTDTGSGFRLNNGPPTQLVRSGLLAFPVADIISGASTPPGILSPAGFPVQFGGAFGVEFSVYDNIAGVAVDDDGSAYIQQVDLINLTGGNIVKIASTDDPVSVGTNSGYQDRSLATSGFFTLATLNPTHGQYGTASGPVGEVIGTVTVTQISTATNYSGTANLFGNIEALAAGPCNNLYAAVSASADGSSPTTEGPFATGASALGATPSMVIRFSDVVGSFAPCTVPDNPITGLPIGNAIGVPIADGFADVVPPAGGGAIPAVIPGVNNFIVFVEGDGPDIRVAPGGSSAVNATTANTLQINDGVGFQVDPTIYAGITVDREGTVYVVSGGTPAGIGNNPSPTFGEILAFPDNCPQDGRADFIDFRSATTFPTPPLAAMNGIEAGDGLSTRADHIFWIAPIDVVNGETDPTAIAGLSTGFELYLNRTRTADNTPELPNGQPETNDGSSGPVIFEQLDPGHQVAGGDDQTSPFTGDDDDGAGSPTTPGPLSGGFEFLFANPLGDVFTVGAACGTGNGVWNGTFWNANGNLTFGVGDSAALATEIAFRAGPPMIAAAWCDLDPGSRGTDVGGVPTGFANTFPVQALGFAGINDFEFRNINVPETGNEFCGSSNTFSTFLFDDGTGVDENANQPLNPANPIGNNEVPFDLKEGPTALRFVKEPVTGVVVGCPPRQDGTGHFAFLYGRMDILGTGGPGGDPVITGFSIGNQNPLNPPALCGIDLGGAAITADSDTFRPCLIGEGTEPEVFELFDTGVGPNTTGAGNPTFATPDFDLRCEGNGAALAAAINTRQTDPNRGRVGFFGTTCQLPPNPTCFEVVPTGTVAVPPGDPAVGSAAAATPHVPVTPTAGIVNALCNVQVNVVGCGIIPNETTIICQTPEGQTGLAETRNGKTVSSTMVFGCDTNGDGVPDLFFSLSNVTPVNGNLIQGTFAVNPLVVGQAGATPLNASAFPLACCGGVGTLTTTTTFSAGDNNIFNLLVTGGFTRTFTCSVDIGTRAPVVISAQANSALNCSIGDDIGIVGSCFILPNGTVNVTSVFAVDQATGQIIEATSFNIINSQLIDAFFNFGSVNAGHTFLIFVSGPNGTSRNLSSPSGTCPAGNEVGVIVTVTCSGNQTQIICDNQPAFTSCSLTRTKTGKEVLTVIGSNIDAGATITVGGISVAPAHVTLNVAAQTFTIKGGGVCKGLPGNIVITNPAQAGESATCTNTSVPGMCNETCPK